MGSGRASRAADDPAHGAALWRFPGDNALQCVRIAFSSGQKGGCEYAKDKLKAGLLLGDFSRSANSAYRSLILSAEIQCD